MKINTPSDALYVYIKRSASEPHLADFLGKVLTGTSFEPKFSAEKIASFGDEERKKFPEPEKLYTFLTEENGYLTINTDYAVLMTKEQFKKFADSGEVPEEREICNLSGAVNPIYAKKVIEGTVRPTEFW